MSKKPKCQWIVNVLLLLFTLLMLVMSVVAWFSNSHRADVDSINLKVDRQELILINKIETLYFPFSTRLSEESSATFADGAAAEERTYILDGEGQITVSVDCHDNGMLAYVCDSTETADYYAEIMKYFEQYGFSEEPSQWTYDYLVNAFNMINARGQHGQTINDYNGNGTKDTAIKIVYWTEFDKLKQKYPTFDSDTSWFSDTSFEATVLFSD